jgi:glucose/arabinose dehydrogenase
MRFDKPVKRSAIMSPFGMVMVGNVLFVADTDAIVRFPYAEGLAAMLFGWRSMSAMSWGATSSLII